MPLNRASEPSGSDVVVVVRTRQSVIDRYRVMEVLRLRDCLHRFLGTDRGHYHFYSLFYEEPETIGKRVKSNWKCTSIYTMIVSAAQDSFFRTLSHP